MLTLPPAVETGYYTLEWAIRLGALVFVPLRRTPDATRSWLLLIFFLPLPGLLLFLAIGRPRFPAWRAARFQKMLHFFADTAARLERDVPTEESDAAALARRLGCLPVVGGNRIELIDDYDAMIDRLAADIDGARHHVRLLVYIFAPDATGRKVVAALKRAVARGVACRVMIDPVGSHKGFKQAMQLLADAGVETRAALPFRFLRGRTRRDMRNHRKLFVIDGSIGYAGSQNIIDKDFRPGVVNRELVARVTGPVVAEMEAVVRADWYLETEVLPEDEVTIPNTTGTALAQLLPSGPDYTLEGFETLLVWQLHRSRERVVIVTPYFIPDQDVLSAMRTATARGVTIDLIVSAVVDQPLVNLAQCSFYDDLLTAGVAIHLFRDYLLHAKTVIIDRGFAVVGSSNVDLRSFQLNEEASLLFYDAESVAAVEAVQQGYIAGSDRLSLDDWRRRSPLRKLLENITRLVSPLL